MHLITLPRYLTWIAKSFVHGYGLNWRRNRVIYIVHWLRSAVWGIFGKNGFEFCGVKHFLSFPGPWQFGCLYVQYANLVNIQVHQGFHIILFNNIPYYILLFPYSIIQLFTIHNRFCSSLSTFEIPIIRRTTTFPIIPFESNIN